MLRRSISHVQDVNQGISQARRRRERRLGSDMDDGRRFGWRAAAATAAAGIRPGLNQ
jgi:hypothetical protein